MKFSRIVGLVAASSLSITGLLCTVPSHADSTSIAEASTMRVRAPKAADVDAIEAQSTSIAKAPIKGRSTTRMNASVQAAVKESADVVKIAETGDPSKRLNFVFMGDGYTAGEQDKFVSYAKDKFEHMFRYEPFKSYRGAINAYAVKVVSRDSGITDGRKLDTALGSYLNCGGNPVLACGDIGKIKSYARNVPKADQILVLLNTRKDVGAGYPSEAVALVTGNGSDSNDAAIHEYGHSLGGLEDEYGMGGSYEGPEPEAANVTKDRNGAKWSSYIGKSTPDGGKIGVFEGGARADRGIYRPSSNSAMRNVGRPFNLVSQDALIKGILEQAPDFRPGQPVPSEKPTVKPTPTVAPTEPTTDPTPDPTEAPTTAPGGNEFESRQSMAIKDYSSAKSSLTSTFAGGKKVTITLDITHSCRQNLDIFITTPDGKRNQVARSTSSSRGCQAFGGAKAQSYTMNSQTEGAWILEISDRVRGNEGQLNGWKIVFSS